MELKLKDRIAFVTGASRGIGRAIATALAAEGVHLALFGRDVGLCETLSGELKARHRGLRTTVGPVEDDRRDDRGTLAAAARPADDRGVGRARLRTPHREMEEGRAPGRYHGGLSAIRVAAPPDPTFHRPWGTSLPPPATCTESSWCSG